MDPITTAITAALVAAASSGITDVGKKAILDAYEGVKALLKRKFQQTPAVNQALEKVEEVPDSPSRQDVLSEQLVGQNAHQDPELRAAVQALLDRIRAQPTGSQYVQNATGANIAQAAGGSTASINISGSAPKSNV